MDRLFKIEETLYRGFGQNTLNKFAIVDGHDIGEGRFNIYIHPKGPWGPVLERVEAYLKLRGALDEAGIAKFHGKTERYQVVWPVGFSGHFKL